MSRFYVWQPRLSIENRHRLQLTILYGGSDQIFQGTDAFIAALLRDIGLANYTLAGWEIKPVRSKYYSTYIGEGNWQDEWQVAWIATLQSKQEFSLPQMANLWAESDTAYDTTWSPQNHLPKEAALPCLLICDVSLSWIIQKIEAAIIQDEKSRSFQARYSVSSPEFEQFVWKTPTGGEYYQLHIRLGKFSPEFFAGGADYAEHVLDVCKSFGATIHFSQVQNG